MSIPYWQRTLDLADRLERLEVHCSHMVMNGTPRDANRLEKLYAAIESDVAALADFVVPKPGRHLDLPARILTLIEALEQMTLARGNHLYQVDGLHECALQFMPDDVRSQWRTIGQHKLAGHIAHQSEVAEQLEARGILVWRSEIDGLIRLVHTNWLTAHAAIREHVMTKVIGRRCQFCSIQESQSSRELMPVDPAKRGKLAILDGVVQLQTKTIHAHLRCIPHWLRWLSIAEQYKSKAEAEASDIEAGRTPGALPALADLETTQEQA